MIWHRDVRAVVGTRQYIALEAAYTGAVQQLDTLGLSEDASLVSTGLEGLVRANLSTGQWQPYVAAGLGWRRYDLTNADFNTSSLTDTDNLLEIPMAAGLSYRFRGLAVDLRGMFRVATQEDLVATTIGQDDPSMHTWGGELSAGWEF